MTPKLRSLRKALRLAAFCLVALLVPAGVARPADAPEVDSRPQKAGPDLTIGREMTVGSLNLRRRKAEEGDCTLFEACIGGVGRRRTLEFDTVVINRGNADLVLGRPQDNPDLYEYSPCHDHYHLKGSLEYSLARAGSDTVSTFDPTSALLAVRNANVDGLADAVHTVQPPAAGALLVAGDWDGDGDSTIGFYDSASYRFSITNDRSPSELEVAFRYRPARVSLRPVAGDWDGDGADTIGLFDPATRTAYLKNSNTKGKKGTVSFVVDAEPGEWIPLAGDWDGNDVDTLGLYDPVSGSFVLVDDTGGTAARFAFGPLGLQPIAGDWDRDGDDTIGLYDALGGQCLLRNENAAGEPDLVFSAPGDAVAIAGDWDYEAGDPLPTRGHKQSFCWLDTQRFAGTSDAKFGDCNVNQGLTAGFGDIYVRGTECQWIDIEGLPAGVYQLRVGVNDTRVIRETDYSNNELLVKVRIPEPKRQRRPAEVKVGAPSRSRVKVGKPVTITWSVERSARVTRQELWFFPAHGHRNEAMILDANIRPGARSYTWVPTDEFAGGEGVFVVRAQDERNLVGDDGFAPAPLQIDPR